MSSEFFHPFILFSAYSILALLASSYRRPLEQLMAEEILTGIGFDAGRAFRKRMQSISKKERAFRWTVRYGFPVSGGLVLSLYSVARFYLWPISLANSLRFYLCTPTKPETLMEICNDV